MCVSGYPSGPMEGHMVFAGGILQAGMRALMVHQRAPSATVGRFRMSTNPRVIHAKRARRALQEKSVAHNARKVWSQKRALLNAINVKVARSQTKHKKIVRLVPLGSSARKVPLLANRVQQACIPHFVIFI